MEAGFKINVLWIDDQPSESFMDEAYREGICIRNFQCVDDGIKRLKDFDVSWDAIILDANCKIHSIDEIPHLKSLNDAITRISSLNIDLPWFVYTGGGYEGEEFIDLIVVERPWDDRPSYKKPSQMKELFVNLKNAVSMRDETKIKRKYEDVCSFYQEKDLVDLLVAFERGDSFDRNVHIPNSIRDILDWVMKYCEDAGVLPVKFNNQNLSECSIALGKIEMVKIVPVYVQRSLHACVAYANPGSHRYTDIKDHIKDGTAKYLNRSAIHELLNILLWCRTLSVEEAQRQEVKEEVVRNSYQIIAEGIVDKDANGFFYCGENHALYPNDGEDLLEKKISILEDKKNITRSSYYYKRIVIKYEIVED